VPSVEQLIRRYARKHKLDPAAVLSVAQGEGGLKWGAVGDQGTSFGPFQLHVGGALPKGRGASWANSEAGLDYALRQMAGAGAAGLQGRAAVDAIVRRFERPADPDTSVQRALARLGQHSGGAPRSAPAGAPPGSPLEPPAAEEPRFTARQASLLASLLAEDDPELGGLFASRLSEQTTPAPVTDERLDAPERPPKTPRRKSGPDPYGLGRYGVAPVSDAYKLLGGPKDHRARALGNWQSDNAWDLGLPVGTPIYATDDGTVGPLVGVDQKNRPKDGSRMTLFGNDNNYWFGHLSRLAVKAGQHVRKGQLIGWSGASQNGVAHLHYAVERL